MSTLHSGVTRAPCAEALSPELVLVDPELAVRAREWLAVPDDTLARLSHVPRAGHAPTYSTFANGGSSSSFDEAAIAAVRRLAQASLAAPVSEPAAERPRRSRRLVVAAAVFSATSALALFIADLQLVPGQAPETAETSALGEPPVVADIGKTPELGSSSGATGKPRAARNPASDASAPLGRSARPPISIPRLFAWAPADGASGYHVELFRGGSRVFAADTSRPQITIPAVWTQGGRRYRLEAVGYRWYVWPIVSGQRASQAIVQATLVVRDR
jgi:hypothetical protein